jgi:ATP-dependent RNA helicase RhlE
VLLPESKKRNFKFKKRTFRMNLPEFVFHAMSKSTFADLKLTRQFLNAIDELGFQTPTPIQEKVIPLISGGQDVIGIAQTGTGKTAAYLLPLLKKLNYAQLDSPRLLIFVPTRELAVQVEQQCGQLAKYTDLRFMSIFGGMAKTTQHEKIKQGVDIIIATPGRFMELYLEGKINLKKVNTLVLDEADRLMDMGFMNQLRSILEVIPRKRQNLLFSATFPAAVERLSGEFLEFPVKIEIDPQASTTDTIAQFMYHVPNFKTKLALLEHLIHDEETFNRVLIFTRTKTTAENLGRYLQRKLPFQVRILHSNKGQSTRLNAFERFREGKLRILVSTDVSARGIDVSEISHVINFEIGNNYENYVHRVGRTGRAEKTGVALSFVNEEEQFHIKRIEDLIGKKIELLPLPEEIEAQEYLPGEEKTLARSLDLRKQKEDPSYQGAFHERKKNSSGTAWRKRPPKKGKR